MRQHVIGLGYLASDIAAADVAAAAAVSARGTTVLRATLALDSGVVFLGVKELGGKHDGRVAFSAFATDGERYVYRLFERQALSLAGDDSATAFSDAVAFSSPGCRGAIGMPPGTCCRYDSKGLFECCAPCVFGGVPPGIACALLWCNYCATAYCLEYYHVEPWW